MKLHLAAGVEKSKYSIKYSNLENVIKGCEKRSMGRQISNIKNSNKCLVLNLMAGYYKKFFHNFHLNKYNIKFI